MIVTTLDHVAGYQVADTLGLARGTAVWSRRVSKTYSGGIRGTELHGTAELDQGLEEARIQATEAVKKTASAMGATAIVGIVTEVRELNSGALLVSVTGTAVKAARLPQAIPAFRDMDDTPDFGMAHIANAMARASSEGSALRH
jgi:uncharacterized protein YbjQ (UPF0145 family)